MIMRLAWLSISLTLIFPLYSAQAQAPSEINGLLRKSKFVDAGREVNTVLGTNQATISTFCHPQATDQDCKVTALLMMKELRQHYKSIHRIRVLFYDPANIHNYRDVEIQGGDVAQVDMGKPLNTVLSGISVAEANHTGCEEEDQQGDPLDWHHDGRGGSAAAGGYKTFRNNDASINFPSNWIVMAENNSLLKVGISRKDGNATIALLRVSFPWGPTVEALASSREAECLQKFTGYKKRAHRAQNCSGFPGVYVEGSAPFMTSELVDRSLF